MPRFILQIRDDYGAFGEEDARWKRFSRCCTHSLNRRKWNSSLGKKQKRVCFGDRIVELGWEPTAEQIAVIAEVFLNRILC